MWSIRPFTSPRGILDSRLRRGVSGVCAADGVATSGGTMTAAKGRIIRVIDFIVFASLHLHWSAIVDRRCRFLIVSLLHRIALPGACAPKVNAVLIRCRPASHRLGEKIFDDGIDLALRQEIVAGRGHVLAHFFARVSVATLVCVREAVMIRHASAGATASYHFGELLGREMRCAE